MCRGAAYLGSQPKGKRNKREEKRSIRETRNQIRKNSRAIGIVKFLAYVPTVLDSYGGGPMLPLGLWTFRTILPIYSLLTLHYLYTKTLVERIVPRKVTVCNEAELSVAAWGVGESLVVTHLSIEVSVCTYGMRTVNRVSEKTSTNADSIKWSCKAANCTDRIGESIKASV